MKELIEKRAGFIAENQIYNCPGNILDGTILPYSTSGIELITGEVKLVRLDRRLRTINAEIACDFTQKTEILIRCKAGYGSTLIINGKRERFSKTAEDAIKINCSMKDHTGILNLALYI